MYSLDVSAHNQTPPGEVYFDAHGYAYILDNDGFSLALTACDKTRREVDLLHNDLCVKGLRVIEQELVTA
jgi:hypothetical protein